MDPNTKRNVIVALSIGAAIVAGLFIKNKIQQSKFQPLTRDVVIQILKKARKENFTVLKQVVTLSTSMSTQMKISQMDPQMVKAYLETPESPLKVAEQFQKNYVKVCQSLNTTYDKFSNSVEYYSKKEDGEIKGLVQQCEKDFELSLIGKLPQIKVVVPESLTKERLTQIHQRITLKRYLMQVQVFRKLRGKSQQDLISDPQLMKSLSNPDAEEEKALQEQGLGQNDQPAAMVYAAGVSKYKNNVQFRQALTKIQTHYAKIFNKYKVKLQQNKISQHELNELEEELIYNPPVV